MSLRVSRATAGVLPMFKPSTVMFAPVGWLAMLTPCELPCIIVAHAMAARASNPTATVGARVGGMGYSLDEGTRGADLNMRPGRVPARRVGTDSYPAGFVPPDLFMGRSDSVTQVLELAQLYAQLAGPILLLGPTGVGKGLLAKLLHRMSGRVGDFVVRTGGQLVESLFQAQLFGSRRGAFTGAERDMPGAFEQADRGTAFLDELPLWSTAAQ